MQNFIAKLGNKYNMIDDKELAVCLTAKVVVPHNLTPILDELYQKASICVNRMLEDRTKSSSKYYKEIPCVLSKSLISKYQRNKKLKQVKNLVLPICGDKGKQVKIVEDLLKKDYTVIQIGSAGLPSNLINDKAVNLIGKTSLEQSMALIKNADVFLGCDSFGQHCASFMKTPAVVMFCGTSPEDFGYPFNSNIFHPEVAFCQYNCGRPMRWLYDYQFSNKDYWNSRSEVGWICPNKICERAITVDEVVSAVEKEIKIGKNRNWTFYDYKYFGE